MILAEGPCKEYLMRTFELIAPCHFGLEAVLKKEILDLGYEISRVEDGRVTFIGDAEAICRANIGLRTAGPPPPERRTPRWSGCCSRWGAFRL